MSDHYRPPLGRRRRPGIGGRAGTTALVVALVAAACASDDDDGSDATATTDDAAATTETTAATDANSDTTAAGETTDGTTDEAPPTTAAPASSAPVTGGTLVVGLESETQDAWVPANLTCAVSCATVLRSVLEPLAVRDESGEIVPFLAESIEPSSDYTTWTIRARPGITFHDGTPFDASAIVDNLTRQSQSILNGLRIADIARDADGNPAITAVDELTVEVQTTRPWADFDAYLTTLIGLMGSPTWLAAADGDPAVESQPVGTGPFVYESYTPGDSYVGVRNDDYWRTDADGTPLPYLDEIQFRPIEDGLTRANALRAGDVDMIMIDDGEAILDFREDDDIAMVELTENGETFYLLLHSGQEGSPLNDQNVRCGLLQATDRQTLTDVVSLGVNPIANGPFSPGQLGNLDDNGNPGFDPDAARELIAAYEAENGDVTINFTTFNDTSALSQAQLIQQWWGDVGVDVDIRQVEFGTMIDEAVFGADEFNVISWRQHGGYALDEQYIAWHSSTANPSGAPSFNFGRLRDPQIDELLDRNRESADPAEKQEIAEALNRRMVEGCFMIPTQWTNWGLASSADVFGLDVDVAPDSGDPLLTSQELPGVIPVATLWRGE